MPSLRFAIVAHHARRARAEALARSLDAHLCLDEEHHGATWNHRRAIEWAAQQPERVVILEDDALPVDGFRERAEAFLSDFPDDLVSLYLGTGRPFDWQAEIAIRLGHAIARRQRHITLRPLLHAVCYSIPPAGIGRVIGLPLTRQVDFAIGDHWGQRIVYAVPSLVDHADGPCVERHADREPRIERRRAWLLG